MKKFLAILLALMFISTGAVASFSTGSLAMKEHKVASAGDVNYIGGQYYQVRNSGFIEVETPQIPYDCNGELSFVYKIEKDGNQAGDLRVKNVFTGEYHDFNEGQELESAGIFLASQQVLFTFPKGKRRRLPFFIRNQ